MYKTLGPCAILRLEDNASIPVDPSNSHYQVYLDWVAEGNTPQPIDPIVVSLADEMQATDTFMARICEDLISALLSKGVLSKADLPAPVIAKLNVRRIARGEIAL